MCAITYTNFETLHELIMFAMLAIVLEPSENHPEIATVHKPIGKNIVLWIIAVVPYHISKFTLAKW